MTDARLPERFLNDRRLQRATAETYRAYGNSLMYAVSNRTDGVLTGPDLEAIPHFNIQHADALVAAGLWEPIDGGWIISDYLTTQTSRAQLEAAEHARVKDAERKARERAAKKGETTIPASLACSPADSPVDNRTTTGNPVDVRTYNIGKDRDRPRTGEVLPPVTTEIGEKKIDPAYPTEPHAVEWRERIDAQGIKSEAELVAAAKVTPNQARRMWAAAFPDSRAA